jgi:hypothetical protein
MEQRSLDELLADVVNRICADGPIDRNQIFDRVLEDEDVKILLDGYRMHDRAEGLEDVILRDMRRKVDAILDQRGGETA